MFSFSTRAISVIMISMVVITGVIIYWMVSPQPSSYSPNTLNPSSNSLFHQVLGVQVVHGATTPDLNCSMCHTQPIPFTGCADCHTSSLPTRITNENIEFPHHRDNEVSCQECHASSANDARFVQVPTANMDFCDNCHASSHD